MNPHTVDDARYALATLDRIPVIAWETDHTAWFLPRSATVVITKADHPGPRSDDTTNAIISHHLAAGGTTLVIGDPLDALDSLPAARWTIELAADTITMRTPDDQVAFTTHASTSQARRWTATARAAGQVAFYTGGQLFDAAGGIDLERAARAGTLIAGAARTKKRDAPRNCPHCNAPVRRAHDRGTWKVHQCTGCPWSTAAAKQ